MNLQDRVADTSVYASIVKEVADDSLLQIYILPIGSLEMSYI